MSERILKALMQLFAIIARVDDDIDTGEPNTSGAGRNIVKAFLRQELGSAAVEKYLLLFDEFLINYKGGSKKKDGKKKKTSLHSVKVLRICTQVNEELTQRQKIIVLVRILEFINANENIAPQELEFAETVADTFNISVDEYKKIKKFVEADTNEKIDDPDWLYITSNETEYFESARHIYSEGIEGEIRVIRISSVNFYFFKYLGEQGLNLNGQPLLAGRHVILNQGSSIRSSRVQPIYYSDIIGRFLSDTAETKIVFKADNIQYHFKGGKIGLHDFKFAEEGGSLIGIMGGSGAGKSTLLNVLNGNYVPSQGEVTVNGVNIHHQKDEIEGVIGYVSQDDLLIEELTVFQNLFYNAKLCFGGLSDKHIAKRVLKTLLSLGLYETKDLKVGSPLEKTISGGQRKRLNIALELIREPSVLFVDEPTSGLSSRDSENIMDLLKELALKGKLIFVVIHQPSSDIFKMFDTLVILDKGGYPIYNGNPVDAVMYFKRQINHVKSEESECPTCGNVNPELIFNIIDSTVVDEYGNLTQHRKIQPEEWNEAYRKELEEDPNRFEDEEEIPESTFKKPGFFSQLKVFFVRDVLSKLTNRQYILINLLEAPALAFILAFFVKYFNMKESTDYVFRDNQNIPQFIFIAVIVALFIGLTVSAEEIIKDQKILKRESFLNLSKGSYLMSKITIMFIISAIQMLLFVAIGNFILEIKGMWFYYWFVLFSLSCFANILGLNISASFNSVKVIYILIPILIIPQLLFSGVIVKFDKLNPIFGKESGVPLIGNVMASRWAYEAMAVTQFKENAYRKDYFEFERKKSTAAWKKDYWLQELTAYNDYLITNYGDISKIEETKNAVLVLKNEIEKEESYIQGNPCGDCSGEIDLAALNPMLYSEDSKVTVRTLKEDEEIPEIDPTVTIGKKKNESGITYWYELNFASSTEKEKYDSEQLTAATIIDKPYNDTKGYFAILKAHYKSVVDSNRARIDRTMSAYIEKNGKDAYLELVNNNTNEALEQFATNKADLAGKIVESNGELIQKADPIYLNPETVGFFGAQFYAPNKYLFGSKISTFMANSIIIWLMTFILIVTLYFDTLKRFLDATEKLFARISFKKSEPR
ncbi:MAG: ATP-binding cassette domain-containing protein [Crocinitomicaceae bacterium]|nr:ATP-binding cassette domain-containing protein [Crocinitomicaceae bacterium]